MNPHSDVDFNQILRDAHEGNAEACSILASEYSKGTHIELDWEKAASYWQKASDLGHIESTVRWGQCLFSGWGVDKDVTKAYQVLEAAASSGDVYALFEFGRVLNKIEGSEDIDKCAFDCYCEAADKGYAQAIAAKGISYFSGRGVAKDKEQGVHWLKIAAEAGELTVSHLADHFEQSDEKALNENRLVTNRGVDKAVIPLC